LASDLRSIDSRKGKLLLALFPHQEEPLNTSQRLGHQAAILFQILTDPARLTRENRFAHCVAGCFRLSTAGARHAANWVQRPQNSGKQSSTAAGAKKSSTRSAPSAEEIAEAKSKGLVWVNLSTHVYYKDGSLYGNTKRGRFMTEEDAQKAGYRLAKGNESPK
jgi:hypothetical protein